MSTVSSSPLGLESPEDVVEKVMRRVEVAKMARKLQDRLALANYKAQNDLANMSFALIEATMIKRKWDASSTTTSSDTSSTSSEHQFYSHTLGSSPVTAPFFSDDSYPPRSAKENRRQPLYDSLNSESYAAGRKRLRTQSMAPPLRGYTRSTWKGAHDLPESSPIRQRQASNFSTSHGPNLSFVSETSTIPNSPPFVSQERDELPRYSYSVNTSKFQASPPRTPPPSRSSATRKRKGNAKAEEGADLLLYLATSPSPAKPATKPKIFAPSTPPSNTQALPSSMMSTPGAGGFMAGFDTPGQHFNFADFVNITPSPAQFGNRTPGPARTPLAAKEARRRLNFDSLVPPTGSPKPGHGARGSTGKEVGLGMELGGELVS